MIAGGGGGSALDYGGGGGGVLISSLQDTGTVLEIKVGLGGFSVPGYGWDTVYASNGFNSSIDSVIALGGGRGGANGGSGGGGNRLGTTGQGFNGGSFGGGGSASAGNGVNGGNGKSSSITGSLVYYGGGGAGRDTSPEDWLIGNPGLGGGSAGQKATSPGGGSGHGFNTNIFNFSIRSADGIVILAYQGPTLSYISPTLVYTLDTTTRSGYNVYTFASGNGYVRFAGTSVPNSTVPSVPRLVYNWGGGCDTTSVRWQEPEWFGNSPITGYKITSSTGTNVTLSSSTRVYNIGGESGTYTIRAVNAIGESSTITNNLTPGYCN